jgi:hypothetical protein
MTTMDPADRGINPRRGLPDPDASRLTDEDRARVRELAGKDRLSVAEEFELGGYQGRVRGHQRDERWFADAERSAEASRPQPKKPARRKPDPNYLGEYGR